MAKGTGKDAYIKFGSTVISTNYRTLNPTRTANLVETQAGNDANKTFAVSLKEGSATVELVDPGGTAGAALVGALAIGTEGTLEWGPEGTAAGKPKHTVNAIVSNFNETYPYADLRVFNVTFTFNGAVTDGAY